MTNNWEIKKLSEVILLQRGHDLASDSRNGGKYPVVASTSIVGYHDEYKVKDRCVLMGRSGTLGVIQKIEESCWPLNTTLYVKDAYGNDLTYIYYYLQTIDYSSFNAGSAVPTLNRNHLANIEINLPPLDEQVRIANVLSSLDSLIDNNKQEVDKYRELFSNMLKLSILEDSESKTLGDVFNFKEGGTSKAENRKADGEYEIMGANGIITGNNMSDKFNCESPSVLIGKIGSAGALNLTYKPVWVTNNAFYVESKEGFTREFIFALLKTIDFKKFIGGSANPYMPKENFIDAPILMPKDISKLDKLCKEIEPLINALVEESIRLSKMRDELLPLLISGEITVKEAEQEIEG